MIKLTLKNGSSGEDIWVNSDNICSVNETHVPGNYEKGNDVGTHILMVNNKEYYVCETPLEICKLSCKTIVYE